MNPQSDQSKAIAIGGRVLSLLEVLGLTLIAIATVIAGAQEVTEMWGRRQVTLADLLLLFIYLEVLAMVGVYLQSGSLPIRMPLYIAMVALARHLILDMKEITETEIIATSAAILILALAVLLIRFGQTRFPSSPAGHTEEQRD
ncbi:phosphate-starvation-inducible E [Thiocapsa imhoffii]|uniref:Protein PsiE n=1 Tax=Thiocapsa imhoffii TaxID=382777 RepID=A0A9X0WKN4_9GAMM|nr:phosphate-starvation-inducible PsiE family protein [Thiocapsa imhoffii]MBK1646256.1 phosphate-starvation-inducible E [Thiocapsa imhoffii]